VFFLCSVLTAQSDSLYFTPKWKRGDEQKVRFNRSERTYDADKLIKDTSYYFEAKYIVRAEDDTSYQLFVKAPNIAMRSIVKAYEKVDKKYRGFRDLELLYRVRKDNGQFELINYLEARSFIDKSMLDLETLVTDIVPKETETVKSLLAPIKAMLSSKEAIDAYMQDYIHFIQYPYGKMFILGDTLLINTELKNPMNALDTLIQTDLYFVQKGSYTNYNVTHATMFDADEYRQFMAQTNKSMSQGMVLDSNAINDKINAMFNFNSHMTVEYNPITSWPKYARFESSIISWSKRIVTIVNYTIE